MDDSQYYRPFATAPTREEIHAVMLALVDIEPTKHLHVSLDAQDVLARLVSVNADMLAALQAGERAAPRTARRGPFDERLMCHVNNLHYDFAAQSGTLLLPRMAVTDMTGTVNLFRAIDPGVRLIYTVSDEGEWTVYRREGDRWRAIDNITTGEAITIDETTTA